MAVSIGDRPSPPERLIGSWCGTRIRLIGCDIVEAPADVSIVGMFAQEPLGAPLGWGLQRLDGALQGTVRRMHADGIFFARCGEAIVFSSVPPPIDADTLIVIGLGEPAAWTPDMMRPTTALAARHAMKRDASNVAFASGLTDANLADERMRGVEMAMLAGLMAELEVPDDSGLESWAFCTRSSQLDAAGMNFALAFRTLAAAC